MTKFNRITKIFFSLLLIGTIQFSLYAAPATIKAKLDSVSILMGKQTKLHYQIVQDKNEVGHFYQEENGQPQFISPNVEIIGEPEQDTTDIENGRIQIDRTLLIQSFDSGVWEIPAAKYIIGKDTILSKALNLKVVPVNIDSLETVHDFKPTETVHFNLFDYLPDFIYYYWWIILLIIIITAAAVIIYQRKKKGKPFIPVKKHEVPPYDEAISALQVLKEEKLWQNGNEKEYFTRLTDILRRYIDRRFQINAIEMTSSQIINTLKRNKETRALNEQLKEILSVADYVKFANVRPLPEDNELAWNRATHFVEDTKPVEIPKTDESESKDNNDNVKQSK